MIIPLLSWGRFLLAIVAACAVCHLPPRAGAAEPAKPQPIAIAEIERTEPVIFDKEVLPILSKKCLSCHNATTHESQLVLETPASILKGGESGPAVTPANPAKSALLIAASRQGDSPMPPPDNDVGAAPLTSAELGLIKLWIRQGATGAAGPTTSVVHWQPLPPGVHPIYAVAVTEDGQWAACSRANQIFLYHLPSARLVTRLTDAALTSDLRQRGAAHQEMVHSLAFNPDGSLLASGGFREIKFWRRPDEARKHAIGPEPEAITALAASRDGRLIATGHPSGTIKIWEADSGRPVATLADTASADPKTSDAKPSDAKTADAKTSDPKAPDVKTPDAKSADAPATASPDAPDAANPADAPAASAPAAGAPVPDAPAAGAPVANAAPTIAGAVTALEFLHDNTRLACGSADKMLRIWNVADGTIVHRKQLPTPVHSLAVMSDDLRVAVAGPEKTIHVWKIGGDEIVSIDSAPAPVAALAAATNDANRLYSGHADNSIRFWDVDQKRQTKQADQGAAVTALAVRGDGQQLASAGANNIVKLWKADSGQPSPDPNKRPLPPLAGDFAATMTVGRWERRVAALSAKADEAKQAATDAEASIKSTAEAIKTTTTAREVAARVKTEKAEAAKEPVEKKAAADKAIETATADKTASNERLAQAKQAAEQDAQNQDLAKARDEAKKLSDEAAAKLKNAETAARDLAPPAAKAVQELLSAEAASAAAEQNALTAVAASQKAVDAAPPAQAAQRDAEKSRQDAQAELEAAKQALEKTKQPIRWLAYLPDQKTLAVGGDNPFVSLWDTGTGVPIGTRVVGASPVTAGALTSGLLIAAADRSVSVWNIADDWKLQRSIGAADNSSLLVDRVLSLAFSPDGALLASGGGEPSRSGELKIWNVADGSLARQISPSHSDTIFALEFSPDGKRLASAGADRMMKVFDASSGSLVKTYEGHTHHVLGVAWRADGKLLATSGADNSIKFWDAATGEQTRPAYSGGKEHTAIRFVGLSSKALVAGADRTVRMFDALSKNNNNAERTYSGPTDFLYALAVSGDGKTVVGGGQDSALWVWNVENGKPIHKFDPPAEEPEPKR